jgi:hypothetical protein
MRRGFLVANLASMSAGIRTTVATLAAVTTLSVAAFAAEVPDDRATPGAINPAVTQDNINQTICRRGWTRSIRPPERYTENIKRRLLHSPSSPYYDPSARLRDYELDHRVPLGVGGAPRDPKNLWDEPRFGAWNAEQKDELEEVIRDLIRLHEMTLEEGQAVFLGDWREGYRQYVERR